MTEIFFNNGKIQFWQVYIDSINPYDIINKSKRKYPPIQVLPAEVITL
jgi:hypothetical protein